MSTCSYVIEPFWFLPFYLCDVGRVAVKHCFKLLSFFSTFIFAALFQFPDSIKFISGLNATVTVVLSDRDQGAKIVAIWQHSKRVLGKFSPRMRRNAYIGASGQKYDLAIRSGDLDSLTDVY